MHAAQMVKEGMSEAAAKADAEMYGFPSQTIPFI
jgi:hypothetical protein